MKEAEDSSREWALKQRELLEREQLGRIIDMLRTQPELLLSKINDYIPEHKSLGLAVQVQGVQLSTPAQVSGQKDVYTVVAELTLVTQKRAQFLITFDPEFHVLQMQNLTLRKHLRQDVLLATALATQDILHASPFDSVDKRQVGTGAICELSVALLETFRDDRYEFFQTTGDLLAEKNSYLDRQISLINERGNKALEDIHIVLNTDSNAEGMHFWVIIGKFLIGGEDGLDLQPPTPGGSLQPIILSNSNINVSAPLYWQAGAVDNAQLGNIMVTPLTSWIGAISALILPEIYANDPANYARELAENYRSFQLYDISAENVASETSSTSLSTILDIQDSMFVAIEKHFVTIKYKNTWGLGFINEVNGAITCVVTSPIPVSVDVGSFSDGVLTLNPAAIRQLEELSDFENGACAAGIERLSDEEIIRELSSYPVMPAVDILRPELLAIRANRPNGVADTTSFMKVGDSATAHSTLQQPSSYLVPFVTEAYDLGRNSHLEEIIISFRNSFARSNISAVEGATTSTIVSRGLQDPLVCQQTESAVDCEARISEPRYALIMLGLNDIQFLSLEQYLYFLDLIIRECRNAGVIPILFSYPFASEALPPEWSSGLLRLDLVAARLSRAHQIPFVNLWSGVTTQNSEGLFGDRGSNIYLSSNSDYSTDLRGVSIDTSSGQITVDHQNRSPLTGNDIRNYLVLEVLYRLEQILAN